MPQSWHDRRMSSHPEALTAALAALSAWDGEDPAALEAAIEPVSHAVAGLARDVPLAETRGPEALAALAGANAALARALSRVLAAETRATATGEGALGERHRSIGRRLREITAQLARETSARVAR